MANVVNGTPWAELAHDIRTAVRQLRIWAAIIITSVLVGLTGPFGTFDALPLAVRTFYWIGIIVSTFWPGYAVVVGIAIWAEARGVSPLVATVIGGLVASLPITGWTAGIHALVFGTAFWPEALRLVPYVALLTPAAAVLSEALTQRAVPSQPARTDPDWLDNLPDHMGRDLRVLRAEGHYVRATTPLGDAMIRARLQDASDAMGAYGLRIHRSWWVAHHAIKDLRSEDGVPVAVLDDGRVLPVGRTYRKAVRAALRSAS